MVDRDAEIMAERLRQSVERYGKESRVCCTISLGLATLSQLPNGCSEDRLLALADERLYQAKKSGRNRVSMAEPIARETSIIHKRKRST